jgi:acyl carrier protein
MATVLDRVKDVVAQVLKKDRDTIQPSQHLKADLGADSVQSVELVAVFEAEFGLTIDEKGALACKTVGDAVAFLRKSCREQGIPVEG